MRKNGYRLLGMLIMVIFSFAPLYAYELKVRVENESTHKPVIEYEVHAYMNNATHDFLCKAVFSPTDSTFMFTDLPENKELMVGVVAEGGLYGDTVNGERPLLVVGLPPHLCPTALEAVTVQGDNSFMTEDKSVFIPSKRDKKISAGGTELLENMAIPTIRVNPADKSISTVSGDGVMLFIDYLPASPTDVANLRTMDVLRVEVYDYPKDPRFLGAPHAFNYVLVEYEYGGYTKMQGHQRFVNELGSYGVNSKFVYKKWTYDLAGGFSYTRGRHNGSRTLTRYDFSQGEIWQNKETVHSFNESRNGYGTLRAVYKGTNSIISNSVGVSGSNIPVNRNNMLTSYIPPSFADNGVDVSSLHSSNTGVSWDGYYSFILNNGYSLVLNPSAAYVNVNNRNKYMYAEHSEVVNDAEDKGWNYGVFATLQKQLRQHSFAVSASVQADGNMVHYYGNSPSSVRTSELSSQLRLSANLQFSKFWLQANTDVRNTHSSLNHKSRTLTYPHYFVSMGMRVNRKQTVTVNSEYGRMFTPMNQLSPNLVYVDNLNAICGNPDLDPSTYFNLNMNYQWLVLRNFSFALFASFHRETSLVTTDYHEEDYDMNPIMVRNLVNSGFFNQFQYGGAATLQLFDNALSMRGAISGNRASRHGIKRYNGDYLSFDASVSYTLNNLYCSARYMYRTKSVSGYGYMEAPQYYSFTAGWSNGNLNVSAHALNPFTSSWRAGSSLSATNNYMQSVDMYGGTYHRSFQISVVYSFSYGKKVGQQDEPGQKNGAKSAIIQ